MSPLLRRASARALTRHPWQVGLSILGIALGVAVALSIELANGSAQRAFALFAETMAGRATHHVTGGPSGLPEDVHRVLRVEVGLRRAAPVVERTVAAADLPGVTFHLLGVDPFAEGPFRSLLGEEPGGALRDLTPFLTQPGAALISRDTARRLGLGPGARVTLRVGAARRTLVIAGELTPRDELSARAIETVLVTDIATAQETLGEVGRLSRIDLIVPEGAAGEALLARVTARLPPGAEIVAAGERAAAVRQMTRAFAVNLTALSLLALVVGMFLIYNTMTFSVVQRRELIGMLRALGVTRRQVFAVVLGEALAIGAVATGLGLVLGIVLGHGMVRLVARTINDLYVSLTVSELVVPARALATAVALGLGGTVLAAMAPAREATATVPRAVLSRAALEQRARTAAPRRALAGLGLLAAGGLVLLVPAGPLALAYAGLFAILLGAGLLTPLAMVGLMRAARAPMGALFGTPGRLAAGSVVAGLSRTSVAVAALMIAVATTVGVGVMIHSFRETVVRWLAGTLQSDVYVSPPSLVSNRPDATLDSALVARLRAVPGVARVVTNRVVRVPAEGGPVSLVVFDLDARGFGAFRLRRGDPRAVPEALAAGGAVIVSEPFAYHRRLGVGSPLTLRTDRGPREFLVAGVYEDYGSTEGVVLMGRRTYEAYWDDRAVSALGIAAGAGVEPDGLVAALRRAAGPEHGVIVRSNRALREASLAVFDRTFAVTVVLRVLATVVAFAGVLSALTALALERARELAVLRAQGLTPRQVWGLVTVQTGLMGLVAGVLALPVGVGLALVLVRVINQRAFGWTLGLEVAPAVLVQAVALALGAALLAGLYPGWRIARQPLAAALREE